MKNISDFILPVIAQAQSSFMSEIYIKCRTIISETPAAVSIMCEESMRQHRIRIRNALYHVMQSQEFRRVFPVANKILRLDLTQFRKITLILLTLCLRPEEIATILLSSNESIRTIISSLKKSALFSPDLPIISRS